MSLREIINHLKEDPIDAWYYIQGNVRLWAREKGWTWLFRKETLRKIDRRLVLAKRCVDNGQCFCCECDTPALMYANKGCSRGKKQQETHYPPGCKGRVCYPHMREM